MKLAGRSVLALALLAASPGSGDVAPGLVAAVQERFDALAREMGFPGATLAVVFADGSTLATATPPPPSAPSGARIPRAARRGSGHDPP